MFQNTTRAGSESFYGSIHGVGILPPAPTFDSKIGVQIFCQDKNVCSESSDNSIYLMQNLRIGNSDCLTFFYSGANAHLIDEQLAEKGKLKLLSSNSTALGVIEGESVVTEYENFRFNHEITAVEMRNVTAGFGKYELEEIGQEFKSTANSTEKNYILPRTVGGTKVQLLLGEKKYTYSTCTEVGVYLSPFKDVRGSRILFAGPSKVFTQKLTRIRRES